MPCLSIRLEHGKVVFYQTISASDTKEFGTDIYGTRLGKGQLAKDPIIFQRGEAANITCMALRLVYTSNKLLMATAANDTDHARIRKLLSHAFSEAALREQEPILTTYFDLLISRLKDQIDGPAAGKVDIMSWYTFTTFDIIGFVNPNPAKNPQAHEACLRRS